MLCARAPSRTTTGRCCERILELRRAKARLLGFTSFADLVLHDRMAHTGEQALRFVERLREKTESPVRGREPRTRRLPPLDSKAPESPTLEPWDVGYYAEKQRQALYDFDEEELRPYFPLERVVGGTVRDRGAACTASG